MDNEDEPVMQCFYLDPGLRDDVGHHANFCREIMAAFRRRGIESRLFSHDGITPVLREEMGAQPWFRVFTYFNSDGDPISGWLSGFETYSRVTGEDLDRLPALTQDDLVYCSTAQPIQLRALRDWHERLPESARPWVMVEIGQLGLDGKRQGDQIHFDLPDPSYEPRPLLYRYLGRCHLQKLPPKLRLISFEAAISIALAQLTGCPVQTLPLPYRAFGPIRRRGSSPTLTLSFLGHQRDIKGYPLVPELAKILLGQHRQIELLVQTVNNGEPELIAATESLRRLAAADRRLALIDAPASGRHWQSLLDRTDLIICPYRPEPYAITISAMACEALPNGIPIVIPAGTAAEQTLFACGGPGLAFPDYAVPSIVATIDRLMAQFDLYAERAHRTALTWPQTHGPDRLIDSLLSLTSAA
jgi:hypothetical protein